MILARTLLAALSFAGGARQAVPPDRIDRLVRSFIERHHIPSAAIAVVRDERVIKVAGYGRSRLELNAPAGPHTVYEIGSITKQFTAEAVLLLVAEGKVDLQAPISRYLPTVPDAWRAITVRHLLTHTSGLPDWEGPGLLDFHREYTAAEYIQLIGSHPLDFEPGAQWSYTNSAFPLLGLMIEAVTGRPYERFVTSRILEPAGMTESRFRHPAEVVPNRAAGYIDSAGRFRNGEPLRPRLLAPNGGILSTAGDMARWDIALSRGAILPQTTLDQMAAPVRLNDGRTFSVGMGWFLDSFRGHRFLLHNGSTAAGFSSVIYRYPGDRLFVVVLMNIDRGGLVNQLATAIADLVLPGLSIRTLRERPEPDPAMARRLKGLLADVAEKRGNDLLADGRGYAPFGFSGPIDRFAFLDREDLGISGVERFGAVVRWIYRYKLVSGARVLYYTFELTPEGKVVRFRPEEG
ncbi:MAG TPA: serine hydrolase domain-containing protein [Gemmatimonadales bacterium]|nr:serine hydrolase domain-containing protein [Gemmatimonadales bacterium]